ncbi:conserved hypothetical protein [uncultured delta proteobacterium]|uniref:FIST C-domain domain-containing protein n=1 Tax=uncultured delta proteobacterium TaxID=34034 RepID=A0A212J973_9DELT|nr:conserved hypothetical protein [uncultured delta proteobacterium]
MITSLVAHTFEIDDIDAAVSDVLMQLDLANALRKHSVGIITCHCECMYSGLVKALSAKLPFDVVGISSLASATKEKSGMDMLTVCVLTSDEVSFTTALTDPLGKEQKGPIARAYAAAAKPLERPSLALAYGPLLEHISGNTFVNEITEASDGVPLFGTLACDHTPAFEEASVIYNGEYYRDRLALVLVYGPVTPKFFCIAISPQNMQNQKGLITASTGNVIHAVNGIPAMEYLESIGLNKEDLKISGSFPLVIDYNDGGQPVGRGIYTIADNGDVYCGGDAPVNASLSTAILNDEDVLRSAGRLAETIRNQGTPGALLLLSCISRSLLLGANPLGEAEKIAGIIGARIPYHMSYSGGEICPVYTDNGATANRFHNFTLIACVL